eukprot:5664912-Prymnesium_polylepis.1
MPPPCLSARDAQRYKLENNCYLVLALNVNNDRWELELTLSISTERCESIRLGEGCSRPGLR